MPIALSGKAEYKQAKTWIMRGVMALYFFDTISVNLHVQDDYGIECGSLCEVKKLAQRALCEMAIHNLNDGDHQTFTVQVRDLLGSEIYTSNLKIAEQYK
ncbi:DUF6894 family protein [Methylorubrum sp. SL192]|uniref:DUF6894 family protein n=1 Tax=Methylorubrum sp. SL192 TaxID=2995167 RepID=UPI0022727E16|nr:hypothetical protein [Methylorubrum sp. SL192]MCY1643194.1 hypothetical protein [Methylorubrum sp. SL192]